MTSRLPDATDLTTLLRRQVDELRQYGLALAGLAAQEHAPGDPSGRVLTHTSASLTWQTRSGWWLGHCARPAGQGKRSKPSRSTMPKRQNAIVPAKYRARVRAWVRHHLPAGAHFLGQSDLGVWWNPPAPSQTTHLVPWKDVQATLRQSRPGQPRRTHRPKRL